MPAVTTRRPDDPRRWMAFDTWLAHRERAYLLTPRQQRLAGLAPGFELRAAMVRRSQRNPTADDRSS